MLRTCLVDGYVAETQWAKYTNNAQTSPVAGDEPREVMPLVSYRASAEVVLYEIHEVGGRRQSAKQVLKRIELRRRFVRRRHSRRQKAS